MRRKKSKSPAYLERPAAAKKPEPPKAKDKTGSATPVLAHCSVCGKSILRASEFHTTPCGLGAFCEKCESLMKDRWRKLFPRWFAEQEHKRLPTILEWRLLQQVFNERLKIEAIPTPQPDQPAIMDVMQFDESELPPNYKEKGYTREPIPPELRLNQPQPVEAPPSEPALEQQATEPANLVEPQPVEPKPELIEPQPVETALEPAKSVELKPVEPEPFRFQLAEHHRPSAPTRDLSDEAVQALIGERLRGKIGQLRASVS